MRQERGDIEGRAGKRRRREEDQVEAVEEIVGWRRVKMRRSGMFGDILSPSIALSLCCKTLEIGVSFKVHLMFRLPPLI